MPDEKSLKTILDLSKSLNVGGRYAKALKTADSTARMMQQLQGSPAIRQMLDLGKSTDELRLGAGPFGRDAQYTALRLAPVKRLRLAGAFDIKPPLFDVDFAKRFTLPDMPDIARLLEPCRLDPLKDLMARYTQTKSSLRLSMEKMRTPWLDIHESMRSVVGFAEMQGIGAAIKSMASFDENLASALRTGFGDWREPIAWPSEIFSDLQARSNLYVDLGFNSALTNFPAPAFEESLNLAGLRRKKPALVLQYGTPVRPVARS